jgi:hypothetical protein
LLLNMGALDDLLKTIKSQTTPASTVTQPKTSSLDNLLSTLKLPTPSPQQPGTKVNKISDFLGGGAYTSVIGKPNELANTGHTNYAEVSPQAGMQRDDIVPVGLSGINSMKENIRMEPLQGEGTATDPIEIKNINDYKAGKISLPQARLNVLTAKQDQEAEKQGANKDWIKNIPSAVTETVTGALSSLIKGFVNPFARAGVSAVNTARNVGNVVKMTTTGAKTEPYYDKGYNIPLLGKVEPMLTGEETPTEMAKKVVSNALIIAPYFLGLGEGSSLLKTINTIGNKPISTLSSQAITTFAKAQGTKVAISSLGLGSMFGLGQSIEEGANLSKTVSNIGKSVATIATLETFVSPLIAYGLKFGKGTPQERADTAITDNKDLIQQKADELKPNLEASHQEVASKTASDTLSKGVVDKVSRAVQKGGKSTILNSADPSMKIKVGEDLGKDANGDRIRAKTVQINGKTEILLDRTVKTPAKVAEVLNHQIETIVDKRVNGTKAEPVDIHNSTDRTLINEGVAKMTPNSQKIVDLANSEFTPYGVKKVSLFPAQPKIIEAAKQNGIDVSGYLHEVDNYAIKHSLNDHANDPMPLTKNDLSLIPDILKNADKVEYSKKNKQGLDSFLYTKKYNGATYYVEEVRTGTKTLNLKTMYKTKTPSGASLAQSELGAVRPPQEEATTPKSVSDTNISQEGSIVKEAPNTRAVSLEKAAVTKKLTDNLGELGSHKVKNMEETASKAVDLLNNNPEEAKRIMQGEENFPKGVTPEALYTASEIKAIQSGDVTKMMELAKSDIPTLAGQRLKELDSKNPDSPVSIMRSVKEAREAKMPKERIAQAKKVAKAEGVKILLPKEELKWSNFLAKIKC